MLSRVATRSARGARGARAAALTRPASAVPQRTLPTLWTRGIANDIKPRFSKPSTSSAKNGSTPNRSSPHPAPQTQPEAAEVFEPASVQASETETRDTPPTSPSAEPPRETPETTEQSKPAEDPNAEEPEPDLSKLPDLTQGIPSTLEHETAGAPSRSTLAAVEGQEGEASPGRGGRGKGQLPASAYVSSLERRRNRMFWWMVAAAGAGTVAGVAYLGRDWDEEEARNHPEIPNGWSFALWWNRAAARITELTNYYQEPTFEKLLPDPQPEFARPYTLCISLEDMLIHNEWTREHGWRVAKRPGVDYFLHYLSQYYEIVLFTTVSFAYADPIVRKLDPYRFIMWPLFREATKFQDGEIVKDLSYLNRDLSKVIIIDTDPKHVRAQPENAIVLPKWTGDPNDRDLVSLIPFLEYIHTVQYDDVRKVLKSFEGKNIPVEFARREALARAEFDKEYERVHGVGKKAATGSSASTTGGGMGMLASMLGLKPSNMSLLVTPEGEENPQEAFAKGKMLQDLARERGQRNYELLEKEIRENGAKWLKEEQEMQEKLQKEAMKNMQSGFLSWFSLGGQKTGEDEPKTGESK